MNINKWIESMTNEERIRLAEQFDRICEVSLSLLAGTASRSTNPETRRSAASDPALSPWARERLAGDPDVSVRRTIAERSDLPPALIERLEVDPDPSVRAALRDSRAAKR
jgi:hypothetical protein